MSKQSTEKQSEGKKDVNTKLFEVSNELTRKPLPRYTKNPKVSELYPTMELEEVSESEGEIDEQEEEDMVDEDTYVEQNEAIEFQNVKKRKGKVKRNMNPSLTSSLKSTEEANRIKKQLQQEKNFSPTLICLYIFLFVIVLALCALVYQLTISVPTSTPTLNITVIMSTLKPDIEKQPKMSFKVIKAALNAVNKTEPTAPAIILLLAAIGAEDQSRRLGEKLVKAVSSNYNFIYGADYNELGCDDGKKKIDDLLNTLSKNEYGAVLVQDLDLIPGGTALMFHTFWDHENAPFKRVVYVMTVASKKVIPIDSDIKSWDQTVYDLLTESWKDINEDQMSPLLARLTVGVAAITTGN